MPAWYSRLWSALIGRATMPAAQIAQHVEYGADFSAGHVAYPGYDVADAMSAYAAFPWVVACLEAKATDLAGLPLRVRRGRGKAAVVIDEHPALDLIAQPSVRMGGVRWRRQIVVDLDLAGNWYVAMLGPGRRPVSLIRLHPERVRIEPSETEGVGAYLHDTMRGLVRYDPDTILHVAAMSYEAGPEGLYGQGKIRALHQDLTTDLRAQMRASEMSKTGRPDVIISPKGENEMWTPETMRVVKETYAKMLAGGGALVIGGSAKVDLPAWNPRDMEFEKVRLLARDAVLAAFHVPPSRVGLPTANYATQGQQMRTYWEALVGDAALIDEQFTRVAARFDPRDAVYHDFSGVESLQESRTSRLERVTIWHALGATPAAAAAYEGFDEAPLPAVEAEAPAPTEEERAVVAKLFGISGSSALQVVEVARGWSAPLTGLPDTEEDRAALWRSYLEEVHEPAERDIRLAAQRSLLAARRRILARLAAEGERSIRRDLADDLAERILGELEERTELEQEMRASLRRSLARALRATMQQVGPSLTIDPARVDAMVDAAVGTQLRGLTGQMLATTRQAVHDIVTEELAKGGSVNDMQARIQDSTAFSPARALLVGRTESTRAVNAGAVSALAEAEARGIAVRKGWLSARDGHVRDAHMLLDGQAVAIGETFTIPGGEYAGATARYPGDFAAAALVCNCRCTVTPVLEKP